jgi:hypothetical protein
MHVAKGMCTRSASGVPEICSRCALLEHAINLVDLCFSRRGGCLLALAYLRLLMDGTGLALVLLESSEDTSKCE